MHRGEQSDHSLQDEQEGEKREMIPREVRYGSSGAVLSQENLVVFESGLPVHGVQEGPVRLPGEVDGRSRKRHDVKTLTSPNLGRTETGSFTLGG